LVLNLRTAKASASRSQSHSAAPGAIDDREYETRSFITLLGDCGMHVPARVRSPREVIGFLRSDRYLAARTLCVHFRKGWWIGYGRGPQRGLNIAGPTGNTINSRHWWPI
jgi:hypothetical protein